MRNTWHLGCWEGRGGPTTRFSSAGCRLCTFKQTITNLAIRILHNAMNNKVGIDVYITRHFYKNL